MPARAAIYLDSNAGAPLSPHAIEALRPLFTERNSAFIFANPSSLHSSGRSTRRIINQAKEKIARSLGSASPESLILTSSGSEANQTVIRSVLETALKSEGKAHWVVSAIEHDSVLALIPWFEAQGGEVSFLPAGPRGEIQVQALGTCLRPETALVSLLWVNNETGVISDVGNLVPLLKASKAKLHLDAAQAWGKLPFLVEDLGADYVTFSGHKIGALSGTGVIWKRSGAALTPLIAGSQEKKLRGGTENVLGALTLGAAAEGLDAGAFTRITGDLRDRLEKAVLDSIPGVWINGKESRRVANTSSLGFEGVSSDSLIMRLDLEGYAVSAGSACSSGSQKPSHVLLAMGQSESQALSTLRISLPSEVTWEMLEGFVNVLKDSVQRIRRSAS